jgi:hypothetical protein
MIIMVSDEDRNNDENESAPNKAVNLTNQDQEVITKAFNVWSETLKFPTVGPFQAFSRDFGYNITEFYKFTQSLIQFQTTLADYWTQIDKAYVQAMNEAALNAPEHYRTKEDLEKYRKVMIDSFEKSFTALFSSREFGTLQSKAKSYELDLLKYLQDNVEKNFLLLNLPTRKEVDAISEDVHDLRRQVRDMKKKLEVLTISDTKNIPT